VLGKRSESRWIHFGGRREHAIGREGLVEFDGQPMLALMVKLMRGVAKDLKLVPTPDKICGIWSAAACSGRLAGQDRGWNHHRPRR